MRPEGGGRAAVSQQQNRIRFCSYSCCRIPNCRFTTGIRTTAVSVCFCKIDCKGVAALNRSLLRESLHGPRPSAAARPPRPPPASIHTSFPCPHLPRPQPRPAHIFLDPPSPPFADGPSLTCSAWSASAARSRLVALWCLQYESRESSRLVSRRCWVHMRFWSADCWLRRGVE